jgi:hypothetical protein
MNHRAASRAVLQPRPGFAGRGRGAQPPSSRAACGGINHARLTSEVRLGNSIDVLREAGRAGNSYHSVLAYHGT